MDPDSSQKKDLESKRKSWYSMLYEEKKNIEKNKKHMLKKS